MNLKIENKENPFDDFKRIACELMNGSILFIGDNKYRFTTLEFYYLDEKSHNDVYAHGHKYQMKEGRWYFHGSGLDITFGEEGIYGGILIRGLQNMGNGEFINGPLLCVQEMFTGLGDVRNLEKLDFYIKDAPVDYAQIYYSRRVGLNEKLDISPNAFFYNAPYRFFTNPRETQKDKSIIAEHLLQQKLSKSEINKLFGYKHYKETE